MERNWRLHDDLSTHDNLLDGFTFDSLILAVRHSSTVNSATVLRCLKDILEPQLEDMQFLVENNMDIIMAEALKGRGQ